MHPYAACDHPAYLENLAETARRFPEIFRPRAEESHKGSHGTLALIGGSEGMSGALVLAATAAMYGGCGKVWAGFRQPSLPMPIIPGRPEIMLSTDGILLEREDISAWVCGCGLGLDTEAAATLFRQLKTAGQMPLLLDADALTLLARHPDLAAETGHGPLILTPHPAEAARLLHCTTAEVQADRTAAVKQLAESFHATVVLKGHRTLVAGAGGQLYENHSGNPGLASGGSGDVLSGIIGALLAQNIDAWQAACGGVWLHGAAADVLRDCQTGPAGMLAGEIAPAARWIRNRLSAYLQEADWDESGLFA